MYAFAVILFSNFHISPAVTRKTQELDNRKLLQKKQLLYCEEEVKVQ